MHGHSKEVRMSRSNVFEKHCAYCVCINQIYDAGTVNMVLLENDTLLMYCAVEMPHHKLYDSTSWTASYPELTKIKHL